MATAEQYADWIVKNKDKKGSPEFEKVVAAYQLTRRELSDVKPDVKQVVEEPSYFERSLGTVPGRALLGATNILTGPLQLGTNVGDFIAEKIGSEPVVGKSINEKMAEVEEMKRRGMESHGAEGFDFAGLGGELATGMAALKGLKIAPTLLKRMGQGSLIGLGFGAAAPVTDEDYAKTKATQMTVGAGAGGAIPLATFGLSKGYQLLRNLADPWLPGGIQRVVDRTLQQAAGSDKAKIAQKLMENKQLPGGASGAGEVAAPVGRVEFSALQGVSEKVAPTPYYAMSQADDAARIAQLKSFGGTKAELQAVEKARTTATKPLYQAVEKSYEKVDVKPVLAEIDDIVRKHPNEDAIVKPLINIKNKIKLKVKGKVVLEDNPLALSSLSKHIKRLLGSKTPGGQNEYDIKTLTTIKGLLDNKIGEAEKAYAAARETFKEMSKPVNQMQVGQYLEGKLVAPLTEAGGGAGQRSNVFAQAVSDAPKTLKKSTGFARYNELDEVLTGDNVAKVNAVLENLARKSQYEKMVQKGSQKAAEIMNAQEFVAPSIGMFNPKYNVLRAITARLAGRTYGKSREILTEILRHPEKTAEALNRIPPQEQQKVIDAIMLIERGAILTTPKMGDN